ncbi:MAG TPA: TonB C-terminal domain-containing protein [Thermodesulfobacteriota bacterium]
MRNLAILLVLAALLPAKARAAWLLERADLPDGATSLWASVDAAESPRTALGTSMPGRLRVGCERGDDPPGAFGVRFGWRPAAPLGPHATVRYRVDDGPAIEEVWSASERGDEAVRAGGDHLDLVAALAAGRTVAIEVTLPGAEPLAWRIDVAATRPALMRVLAYCAGVPFDEALSVEALVGRWREAAEVRARALGEARARIREAAAARERALEAYAETVRRAVTAYWIPPERRSRGTARVSLTVARSGRVLSAGLAELTGDGAFDWSIVSALDKAREAGLPPLPPDVEGEQLEMEVVLDLPAKGRSRGR